LKLLDFPLLGLFGQIATYDDGSPRYIQGDCSVNGRRQQRSHQPRFSQCLTSPTLGVGQRDSDRNLFFAKELCCLSGTGGSVSPACSKTPRDTRRPRPS